VLWLPLESSFPWRWEGDPVFFLAKRDTRQEPSNYACVPTAWGSL